MEALRPAAVPCRLEALPRRWTRKCRHRAGATRGLDDFAHARTHGNAAQGSRDERQRRPSSGSAFHAVPTQIETRRKVCLLNGGDPKIGSYKWSSRIGEQRFAMKDDSVERWLSDAGAFRKFEGGARERMLTLLSRILTDKCAARVAWIGRTSVGCNMHGDRNATRVWQAQV